jgi:hypothetical protein
MQTAELNHMINNFLVFMVDESNKMALKCVLVDVSFVSILGSYHRVMINCPVLQRVDSRAWLE